MRHVNRSFRRAIAFRRSLLREFNDAKQRTRVRNDRAILADFAELLER